MDTPVTSQDVILSVPRELVKQVKTTLERSTLLDRSRKITPSTADDEHHVLPTLFNDEDAAKNWMQLHLDESIVTSIKIQLSTVVPRNGAGEKPSNGQNSFTFVIRQWLTTLRPTFSDLEIDEFVKDVPSGYSIYKPMLLLPPTIFTSSAWQKIIKQFAASERLALWHALSNAFGVTHIAINAPIPLHKTLLGPGNSDTNENSSGGLNILRSPSGLEPLYGDFGPKLSQSQEHEPEEKDFNEAFWVSSRQNGIEQIWAPRYTMFSRGNVKEKARILALASSQQQQQQCTAIDLYAGIGYFAFSYVKAGCGLVIGFEMNAWSVEGFSRGAELNGWKTRIIKQQQQDNEQSVFEAGSGSCKLLVYQTDNSHATEVVGKLRDRIPPIRHVNLGLLPSSQASWSTAVDLIDSKQGGWIHVHENFATDKIAELAEGVCQEIQRMYGDRQRHHYSGSPIDEPATVDVVLEHVERVKTYAPGVMHCVLDIYLPGLV